MGGRDVFAALSALIAAGSVGCEKQYPPPCAGVAVVITPTYVPTPADGGTDADPSTDGGGADGKPTCTGNCREYLEALRAAIEANIPATCVRPSMGMTVACVPGSSGCPTNTVEEARALETQISAYLAAEWPEIDMPLSIDTCLCNIN